MGDNPAHLPDTFSMKGEQVAEKPRKFRIFLRRVPRP